MFSLWTAYAYEVGMTKETIDSTRMNKHTPLQFKIIFQTSSIRISEDTTLD